MTQIPSNLSQVVPKNETAVLKGKLTCLHDADITWSRKKYEMPGIYTVVPPPVDNYTPGIDNHHHRHELHFKKK